MDINWTTRWSVCWTFSRTQSSSITDQLRNLEIRCSPEEHASAAHSRPPTTCTQVGPHRLTWQTSSTGRRLPSSASTTGWMRGSEIGTLTHHFLHRLGEGRGGEGAGVDETPDNTTYITTYTQIHPEDPWIQKPDKKQRITLSLYRPSTTNPSLTLPLLTVLSQKECINRWRS